MTENEDEKIIDRLLLIGNDAYKKNFRKLCPSVARKLDRHETIEIDGQEYTCWRELVVISMSRIIAELCPDIEIEINLDGNDSTLSVSLSEEDEKIIQTTLKKFVS